MEEAQARAKQVRLREMKRLANLDPDLMRPVNPRYWPRVPVDLRLAWIGPAPGSSGAASEAPEVRVEAGYLQGLPAAFAMLDEEPPPAALELRQSSFERMVQQVSGVLEDGLMIVVLLAGLVIMIQNFRARRGDRQGALRLAAFVSAGTLLKWLINARYVGSPSSQFNHLGHALGISMYLGALAWMLYLGLEPLMRRIWPQLLVGWTRALEGRFKDPMVARDLLVGLAMGLLLSATAPLISVLTIALGTPPPRPFDTSLDALASGWGALGELLEILPLAPINALLGALLFTLARLIFRRQWIALLVLFPIAILSMPMEGTYGSALGDLAVNSLKCTIWAVTLLRFGVLATSVTQCLYMLLAEAHLTLDLSAWHATPTILLLFLVVAIGLFGARYAVESGPGS